jgi:hypothetical protein
LSSRLLSRNVKVKIYKTIILPVVLYGCETWSLTLREEEHRLRAFEDRVLRGIFGPKRDELTGEWRKLHNEIMKSQTSYMYKFIALCRQPFLVYYPTALSEAGLLKSRLADVLCAF